MGLDIRGGLQFSFTHSLLLEAAKRITNINETMLFPEGFFQFSLVFFELA